MTFNEFEKVLRNRTTKIWDILALKAKEYASDDDRLHNFKRAAAMQNITPEKALIGMFTKHMVSILDMVDDLVYDCNHPTDIWDE